jgi:hypothetical protein
VKVIGQFQFTYDDYREAIQAISKSAQKAGVGGLKFGRGVFGWVLFIGLAIMLFIFMRQRQATPSAPAPTPPPPTKDDPWQAIVPILPWALVFGFVYFFVIRRLRGAQQRQWDKLPHMHRPRTIEIDDEGVTMSEETSSTRMNWAHFQKFEETPNLFLLYVADIMSDFIPKRAFADQAAVDAVRELFQQNISPPTSGFPVTPLSKS